MSYSSRLSKYLKHLITIGWSCDVDRTCDCLKNAYKNTIYCVFWQEIGKNEMSFNCEFERENRRGVDDIPWFE